MRDSNSARVTVTSPHVMADRFGSAAALSARAFMMETTFGVFIGFVLSSRDRVGRRDEPKGHPLGPTGCSGQGFVPGAVPMLQHRFVRTEHEVLQADLGAALTLLGGGEVLLAHHQRGEVRAPLARGSILVVGHRRQGGLGQVHGAFTDGASRIDAEHLATHRGFQQHHAREQRVDDAGR